MVSETAVRVVAVAADVVVDATVMVVVDSKGPPAPTRRTAATLRAKLRMTNVPSTPPRLREVTAAVSRVSAANDSQPPSAQSGRANRR